MQAYDKDRAIQVEVVVTAGSPSPVSITRAQIHTEYVDTRSAFPGN